MLVSGTTSVEEKNLVSPLVVLVGNTICILLELTFIFNYHIIAVDEATSCEDGDVRLEGGFSDSNGRVEFCQYRTWGAVCSEGWDNNDARVVCGQLGYSNTEGIYHILFSENNLIMLIRCKNSGRV